MYPSKLKEKFKPNVVRNTLRVYFGVDLFTHDGQVKLFPDLQAKLRKALDLEIDAEGSQA